MEDNFNFNIDIPIIEMSNEKRQELCVEHARLEEYIKPSRSMLEQHRIEYKQYIQSLVQQGCTKIFVDGKIVYEKKV